MLLLLFYGVWFLVFSGPLLPHFAPALLRRYQPAAFVVEPACRNQPVPQRLCQLLLPRGYREQPTDRLVLFAPPGR